MKRYLLLILGIPCLILAMAWPGGRPEAQPSPLTGEAETLFEAAPGSKPKGLDAPASQGLVQELNTLTEELCHLALGHFNRPEGDEETNPMPPIMGAQAVKAESTASSGLEAVLDGFTDSLQFAPDEKVTSLRLNITVSREAKFTEAIKPPKLYHDLKESLNDRNAGPLTDEDLEDLVTMIGHMLAPPRIHRVGNGFGPEDYCCQANLETSARKLTLTIVRHGGTYLWYTDDEAPAMP